MKGSVLIINYRNTTSLVIRGKEISSEEIYCSFYLVPYHHNKCHYRFSQQKTIEWTNISLKSHNDQILEPFLKIRKLKFRHQVTCSTDTPFVLGISLNVVFFPLMYFCSEYWPKESRSTSHLVTSKEFSRVFLQSGNCYRKHVKKCVITTKPLKGFLCEYIWEEPKVDGQKGLVDWTI